jgi:hypothetical protein
MRSHVKTKLILYFAKHRNFTIYIIFFATNKILNNLIGLASLEKSRRLCSSFSSSPNNNFDWDYGISNQHVVRRNVFEQRWCKAVREDIHRFCSQHIAQNM